MPLDVTRTRARMVGYTRDPETDPRADKSLNVNAQFEDFAICKSVQAGLRSQIYRPGPMHHLELKVSGFQQRLLEMLAR